MYGLKAEKPEDIKKKYKIRVSKIHGDKIINCI